MSEQVSPSKRDQFRQLSVLIAVSFIDMLGFFLILPILPFYALDFHATPEAIGWLIASFSIAQLVAAPLWGRLSDRIGRRPVLLISLFASSLAFLVFGLADALWLLFVSRLIQGAGGGTTGVTHAYISDTVGPDDRARALGWLSAATAAGVMVGPAIGSAATALGRSAPGLIASALCLCNVIAAWRWLPESRRADVVPPPRRPVWHAAWEVVRTPKGAAPRLVLIYGVGMLAFSLVTSVLALWLEARFAVTEATIGYFFVYTGLLSLVMRSLLLGPVIDRLGEVGAMRLGTVVLAAGLLLYPVAPNLWVLAGIIPLIPIGTALLFPATTSLLSKAAVPGELGTTMGVAQTFAGISRVVAPIVGTIAFQRLGVDAPFLLGGLVVSGVGLVAFRYIRASRPVATLP
ncbi:MAG TPA: MFS transporter [Gemmatimonadales bacterium]|nr:MFS transporter [Gemmatimonadales bacterium]